jgi:hypothetical protein
MLNTGGQIWIPHLDCTSNLLNDYFINSIDPFYDCYLEADANNNPLYEATEYVEQQLLLCPDNYTNKTQMKPYLDYSEHPFLLLERKEKKTQRSKSFKFALF